MARCSLIESMLNVRNACRSQMLVSMMNGQYEGIRLTELLICPTLRLSRALRQTCSFSHLGTTMTIKVCRHQDNVYKNSNEFDAIRLLSFELLTSNH